MTQNLNTLTAKEFKNIIPLISTDLYSTSDLATYTHDLINLLADLKAKTTYKFMKKVDDLYPGLSFHYIMEARHILSRENALFLYRIAYHMYTQPEKPLFQPMRVRLITGLLFSECSEDSQLSFDMKAHFEALKNSFLSIDTLSGLFLEKTEKKMIKNIIFKKSFELYFTHLSKLHSKY